MVVGEYRTNLSFARRRPLASTESAATIIQREGFNSRSAMKRRLALVVTVLIGMIAARSWGDDFQNPPADADGALALASRFETFSKLTLREHSVPQAGWYESLSLLQAAAKLDANEPRYIKAVSQDQLYLGDSDGALASLKIYSRLKPDDQTALVRIIDLYLNGLQSSDTKIAYLKSILDKEALPAPVRSEAAYQCAQLYMSREQTSEAKKMLDSALTLNPLNLPAMHMKYSLTSSGEAPAVRVTQLMAMLKAAPANPEISTQIAEELAAVGMVRASIDWYTYANDVYGATNLLPEREFALGAGAELLINNRPELAAPMMTQYCTANPYDSAGWLLRCDISQAQADETPSDKTVQSATADVMHQASNALTNIFAEARLAAGDTTATTRPISSPDNPTLPDLSGDVDRLHQAHNPQLTDAYVAAASDLVWYDLFYQHNTDAADPVLAVLGNLLSDKDVQLARLRGWREYIGGNSVAATTKLSAAAANDPLAALGLVLIDLADTHKHDAALARGKQLLSNHPAGLIGATIATALRKYDVAVEPTPDASAVGAAADAFPIDYLAIVSRPQSYYLIHAEPDQDSYVLGQPILIRVVIENISSYDLPIGTDYALQPGLWFDAYLRGIESQSFPGAVFDQIDGRLVLPSGQSVTELVRVDDEEMNPVFSQNPNLSLTVNFGIVTNPRAVAAKGPNTPELGQPGPCGYSVQLSRMVLRTSSPIYTESARNDLLSTLQLGDGGTKIRTLDVLQAYARLLQKHTEAGAADMLDKFMSRIKDACDDREPSVSAWAKFIVANLSSADDQNAWLLKMSQDDAWQTRLLCLVACGSVGTNGQDIAQSLSKDKEPIVATYAKALADRLSTEAAQQAPAAPPPAAAPITIPTDIPPAVPPSEPATPSGP
jgi:tetratricopeptide (TPR) repeat protein